MDPMDSPSPRANGDELDKLLDYDNAVNDFLKDIPTGNGIDASNATAMQKTSRDEDQEVQIKRKRNPAPKLDEERLLSNAGIPKLRRITKTRLKFRGKGHEFSDISRLLNTYQLWLDDLYPRAKFRDGLAMVEKVGHSKRMQVTRKAWLDETKPYRREQTPTEAQMGNADANRQETALHQPDRDEDLFAEMMAEDNSLEGSRQIVDRSIPQDDELDDLLAENAAPRAEATQSAQPKRSGPFENDYDDEPDQDELDALLEEQAPSNEGRRVEKPKQRGPFMEDEDDLDSIMAEQEFSRPRGIEEDGGATIGKKPLHSHRPEDDFAAEEEAMADYQDIW